MSETPAGRDVVGTGTTGEIFKPVNIAWVLPRPSASRYKGSMPLHAEIKILREIGCDPKSDPELKILHPFGGRAEYGVRCDLNPDVDPHLICDAHNLPFGGETFDVVVLDPPYSKDFAAGLYGAPRPRFRAYTTEAIRVLKRGGFLVVYHYVATPSLAGVRLAKRILIETRVWHTARVVHIHRKG